MNRIRRHRAARRASAIASVLAVSVAWIHDSDADTFCTPPVQAIPNQDGGAPIVGPTMDGIVEDDPGWLDAYRNVTANGTPSYDVAVQALKSSTDVFFSVEVPDDSACSQDDGVVFAFDTKPGNPTATDRFRRVSLRFPPGSCSTGNNTTNPAQMTYATGKDNGSGGVTWALQPAPPAGTVGAFTGAANGATGAHWQFELKLPISGFGLGAGNKMYWNVITTAEPINGSFEFSWPIACADPPASTAGCIDQVSGETKLPDVASWGDVDLAGTACKGVSIPQWGGISVSTPTAGDAKGIDISLLNQNWFHAQVKNDGTTTAQNITASFRIANFGTSYAGWQPIDGVPGNPTASSPATNIDAGASVDLVMGPWALNADQQTQYRNPANPYGKGHQCVEVVLNSTTSSNVITRSRAYTNMEVGSSSVFMSSAEINTHGLAAPPNGAANHDIVYRVLSKAQYAYGDGSYPALPVGRVGAQLHWYFRPYRVSGRSVDVFGTRHDLLFPGPGFAYDVTHDMPDAFQKPFNDRHAKLLDSLTCHPPPMSAAKSNVQVDEGGSAHNNTAVRFQDTDAVDAIVCWATGNDVPTCGAAGSGATGTSAPGCTELLKHCINGDNCNWSTRGPLLTATNEKVTAVTCDAAGVKTPTTSVLTPVPMRVSGPGMWPEGGNVQVGQTVLFYTTTQFVTFVYTTDGTTPSCAGGGTSKKVNAQWVNNDGVNESQYEFALTGSEKQINVIGCRASGVNGAPTPGDFDPTAVRVGQPLSFPVVIGLKAGTTGATHAAAGAAPAKPGLKPGAKPVAAALAKPKKPALVAPKVVELLVSGAAAAPVDDGCYKAPDPRFYAKVNAALAHDSERPDPNDFATRVDGMNPAVAGDPSLYRISVPPNSVVKISASAGYKEAPPPPNTITCSCRSTEDTPILNYGAIAGALSLGGVYLLRRRRRAA